MITLVNKCKLHYLAQQIQSLLDALGLKSIPMRGHHLNIKTGPIVLAYRLEKINIQCCMKYLLLCTEILKIEI